MASKKLKDTCGFGENTIALFMGYTPKGYAKHRQLFIESCKEVLPDVVKAAGFGCMTESQIQTTMESSAKMTISMLEMAMARVDAKLNPQQKEEMNTEGNAEDDEPMD